MARIPKPWWREERQSWYVTIDGERTKLGPDEAEATRRFHELMSKRGTPPSAPASTGLTVAELFDKYLDWCQKHREPRTYDWYRDHIQAFLNRNPAAGRLPVMELCPYHVVEWVDSHTDNWSPAFQRGAIIAIQRPFNWGAQMGHIKSSPVGTILKPTAQRRKQAITSEQWEEIKNHYDVDDPFREILEFSWDTGCRPQEVKKIEARHVELEHHRVAFPTEEAKGKKRPRFIYLTPRAEEILKRNLHRDGVLFRNEDGNPWTAYAMSCRFGRLKKHLGVRFCAYALRHGFATAKLLEGLDALTIAEIMGHRDLKMLAETYQHLDQHGDHLRRVLEGRTQEGKDR